MSNWQIVVLMGFLTLAAPVLVAAQAPPTTEDLFFGEARVDLDEAESKEIDSLMPLPDFGPTPVRKSQALKKKKTKGKRNLAAESVEDRKVRLAHAKELLGKYYRRSVVRSGEQATNVNRFVLTTLQVELPHRWKKQARRVQEAIIKQAEKYKLDPIFLVAVIENESQFNPIAIGGVGEIGLMQLRPGTAKWICELYGLKWKGKRSLRDPVTNIEIGSAFLNHLRDDFENHGRLYLSAYNMGQKNVRKSLGNGIWPRDYAIRVMEHYIRLYTELSETSASKSKI